MKSAPKIITALFLLQFIGLALLFVLPKPSNAADPIKFTPQIGIPNSEFTKDKPYEYSKNGSTLPIAQYIRAIYKYAIGIVGILATVVMMVGGIIWLTAGGNATRVGEAKSWITASLTGLVLALASYLILATVNPALTNFKITPVKTVVGMGCCEKPKGGGGCSTSVTKENCESGWKDNESCNSEGKCEKIISCCAYDYTDFVGVGYGYKECSNNIYSSEQDCKNKVGGVKSFLGVEFSKNKQCTTVTISTSLGKADTQRCMSDETVLGCCVYEKNTINSNYNHGEIINNINCNNKSYDAKFCGANTVCEQNTTILGTTYWCP